MLIVLCLRRPGQAPGSESGLEPLVNATFLTARVVYPPNGLAWHRHGWQAQLYAEMLKKARATSILE